MNIIHGYEGTPTYNSWRSMKQRCLNKNSPDYKHYGGRGITVCERWMDFKNFLDDMGKRPKGMSLDRIDNDGNYEPSNCKWSNMKEQSNNRRTENIGSNLRELRKLSDDDILEIRKLLNLGIYQKYIAQTFNITQAYVSEIKNNKKRKEIII